MKHDTNVSPARGPGFPLGGWLGAPGPRWRGPYRALWSREIGPLERGRPTHWEAPVEGYG